MLNLLFIWDKNIQQKKKKQFTSCEILCLFQIFSELGIGLLTMNLDRNLAIIYIEIQNGDRFVWMKYVDLPDFGNVLRKLKNNFYLNFAPSLFDLKKIEDAVLIQRIDCQIELQSTPGNSNPL